jgi:hypothetical protein
LKKVPIRLHTANALKWLGSLYRNPADAIKEHVSNAIDEHLKAQAKGQAAEVCRVSFTMQKDLIQIEYPYGMSRDEFDHALQKVADSAKRTLDINQIGQLGIGMFSFLQIGKKCTFYSKKDKGYETIKVTLREGSDEADFETATKKESLQSPGIKISIGGLLVDPTKPRGPLSVEKLQKTLSERFDTYLKAGSLAITIIPAKGSPCVVEPQKIELPKIGTAFKNWPLAKNREKRFSLDLYFDRTGKGRVSLRHMGVSIVDDIKTLSAYGLEDSVYSQGDLRGFIDADFLKPLPARTGFEENEDWISFLDELDKLRPSIEAEVEVLKKEETEKKLTEIQKQAIELARDILNTEEFRNLELLDGMGRRPPVSTEPPHGFDFVPASIRIRPSETAALSLKAAVPKKVADGSCVRFTLDDSSCVTLLTHTVCLNKSDAQNGIVAARVRFQGKETTEEPVLLAGIAGDLKAEAHIRVGEPEQEREPKSPGIQKEGSRINFVELPFEDGPSKHSRYISRQIQINTLNHDYIREARGYQQKLAYAVLMIGKETIAYQDKSGGTDEHLENMLSFYFRVKDRLAGVSSQILKRQRGRPKKST